MNNSVIVPDALSGYYAEWHFSPAVMSGEFLFISGCTGTFPDGTISDDIQVQTQEAFRKIGLSLAAANLSFKDIVDLTTYHVGLQSHLDQFRAAKDEFIVEPFPAWTAVGVTELAVPGALIEIKAIAKR